MMKIAALIPLTLEINNLVDFLNLIPNVEEHNLEFVEHGTRKFAELATHATRKVF